jgi:hypothetical protein
MLSSSPIRGGQALLAPNTAFIGKRLRHSKTGAICKKWHENEKSLAVPQLPLSQTARIASYEYINAIRNLTHCVHCTNSG